MKLNRFLALLTLIISGLIISANILQVNAGKNEKNKPISSFITKMSGRVLYKAQGSPISGVLIKAKNKQTNKVIEARTNSQGEYTIEAVNGTYTVTPFSAQIKRFDPASRLVNLYTVITGVNFAAR